MGPCMCGDPFCESCHPGAAQAEADREALFDILSGDLTEAINPDWLAEYIEAHADKLYDWLQKIHSHQPVESSFFDSCAYDFHEDCIGESTAIYRDGRLVRCTCSCHISADNLFAGEEA